MRSIPRTTVLCTATVVALTGCFSRDVRDSIDAQRTVVQAAIERPAITNNREPVQSTDRLYIPLRKVVVGQGRSAWLVSKKLSVDLDSPVPLSAVLRMIGDQGVNITSDLPLDSYTWSGKITGADSETALRMILGGAGLDYDVDDVRRLVTVRPVRSRTWTLNLGNRTTKFSSGGQNAVGLTDTDTNVTAAGGTGGMGNTYNNAARSGGASEGARITSEDNFWKSLRDELDNRLQVRIPGGSVMSAAVPAGAPAGAPSAARAGDDTRKIGTYALNPETGAVTVSAPQWVLSDLDGYMARVQAMYNAEITFTGELLMVTRNRSDSEGLDVSAFGNFARNRFGAVIQNNALGGVTLSFPNGANNLASVAAEGQSVPGALMGIASPADSLQLFNAWLSEVGRVSVVQRPVITTTSGVPAEFSKESTTYFNLVSQETAAGGISGAVSATRNTLQSKTFGTQLTINPRYDYGTGLIRAHIKLSHVLPNGQLLVNQTINVGDSFKTIGTPIPLDTKHAYSGEALLRDGDLVIIGGQSEESESLTENGLPARDGTLSGIFGKKNANRDYATYYFALRVSIKAR